MEPGCANNLEGFFKANKNEPINVNMGNTQFKIDMKDINNMFGYIL
jgi:hypothetical protein